MPRMIGMITEAGENPNGRSKHAILRNSRRITACMCTCGDKTNVGTFHFRIRRFALLQMLVLHNLQYGLMHHDYIQRQCAFAGNWDSYHFSSISNIIVKTTIKACGQMFGICPLIVSDPTFVPYYTLGAKGCIEIWRYITCSP